MTCLDCNRPIKSATSKRCRRCNVRQVTRTMKPISRKRGSAKLKGDLLARRMLERLGL